MSVGRRKRLGAVDPFELTEPHASAKRCAVRVRQGRVHPRIPDAEPYEVCLSPTQYEKLFKNRKPKVLGCGTWACAYDVGQGRVIKITADPEDVAAFKVLRKHPRVAKVFRDHELVAAGTGPTGKPKRVFALEMEKLAPLSSEATQWVEDALIPTFAAITSDAAPWLDMAPQFPGVKTATARYARSQCAGKEACRRFVDDFLTTYTDLFRKGVWWQDFHAKNFGVDDKGRWKILDLGMSRQKLSKPPKLLAGARFRRRRGA